MIWSPKKLPSLFIALYAFLSFSSYAQRGGASPTSPGNQRNNYVDQSQYAPLSEGSINALAPQFRTGQSGGGLFSQNYGGAVEYRVLHQLFGGVSNVFWPPPPRIWVEFFKEFAQDFEVFIGPQVVPGLTANIKRAIQYKVTSSLLVFGSSREYTPNEGYLTPAPEELFTTDTEESPAIRKFFEREGMEVFPNVKENHPMVGACYYQISLRHNYTVEGGLKFIAAGAAAAETLGVGVHQSHFSNFFQLRPDRSIEFYQQKYCKEVYEKKVAPKLHEMFKEITIPLILRERGYCSPPYPGQDLNPEGDDECLIWFKRVFGGNQYTAVQRNTVPRCMKQERGLHRCEIVATEGKFCPLYYNSKSNTYSEKPQRPYNEITSSSPKFACDKSAGLACKFSLKWSIDVPRAGPVIGFNSATCQPHDPKKPYSAFAEK